MTTQTILSIGLDPTQFEDGPPTESSGPKLDHDQIMAGAKSSYDRLRSLGFTIERCLVEEGDAAEAAYRAALADGSFDYIIIGSGIRLDPNLSYLLEMLVNVSIELSPGSTLVFDDGPAGKADAVLRWYTPSPAFGSACGEGH